MRWNRKQIARYLLVALLIVAAVWGMWRVPIEPQRTTLVSAGSSADKWDLAPLAPARQPKQIAQRFAKRQGWSLNDTPTDSGESTQSKSASDAKSHILGVSTIDGDVVVVLMQGRKVITVKQGDNLPDGRKVTRINDTTVTLGSKQNGHSTLHLFPYNENGLGTPGLNTRKAQSMKN